MDNAQPRKLNISNAKQVSFNNQTVLNTVEPLHAEIDYGLNGNSVSIIMQDQLMPQSLVSLWAPEALQVLIEQASIVFTHNGEMIELFACGINCISLQGTTTQANETVYLYDVTNAGNEQQLAYVVSNDQAEYFFAGIDPSMITAVSVGVADLDNDSVLDAQDNCIAISNTAQLDTDNDGDGDACDGDDDNDGLSDLVEQGLGTNPLISDSDGDNVSDLLEVEAGTNPLLNTSFPILHNGDVNGDGQINLADLLIASKLLLRQQTATPLQFARLDVAPQVSGVAMPDGQFNLGDILVLLKMLIAEH